MTDADGLRVGDERIVEIGPVAHGGHFIAHSDGRTLFVRHAMTGERVRVRVTEVTRKIVRADAVEVLQPSPDRVTAPCAWARPGGCGGCDFQHVRVAVQRDLKTLVLHDALQRLGRVTDATLLEGLDVEELPGHPDGLGWRSRMTWARGTDGVTGLHRHRSHAVVPIDRCLIAAPDVSRPADRQRGKVLHEVRDRAWRMSADDFWQVHPAAPEALVDCVLDLGAPTPGQAWWDLYSGAGLFAAFLGEAVGTTGSVDAVEAAADGARAARRALHDLAQVRLNHGEVAAWLADHGHARPDGVVLDPPRAGAGQAVVAAIAASGAPTVVYVACDPAALARDVAHFALNGYTLDRVRSFDAFPMTHHMESVALLSAPDS